MLHDKALYKFTLTLFGLLYCIYDYYSTIPPTSYVPLLLLLEYV